MQTFLHYRWRVPSTLHRLHPRRIIPLLLLALCVTGAKAADVPSTWKPVTFNENIRYSQWVINSRISDFRGNTTPRGFNTYDASGKEISKAAGEQDFDYVPGLVAKAILEAYANYSTFDWSKPWFYSVMNYAKDNSYTTKTAAKGITLDNMNACKMYFPLMAEGVLDNSAASNGTSTITAVIDDMKTYNTNYVIGNATYSGVASSTNETVKSMFGGWFHKPAYKDQMWCDGLYMGAALLAQIVKYKGNAHNITASSDTNDDWDLIAKQFTISWTQLYNSSKGLLYHAFTANPKDEASSKWAGISNTEGAEVYHSAAFWGRAMGWYFLALVDVLEQMPSNNSNRATLIDYLEKLAAGLAKYQDAETGCWYQVIDEKDTHLDGNYLESSCTSLFAAAYLKAVRLGFLTSNGTYDYKTIGVNAFKGAVNQFMKYDTFEPTGTTVQLVHNCASAGLGGTNGRTGSRQYYITGSDVGQTNTYTEGKVMGAFIMAATEYERAPENQKAIRFSYDLAPAYTLTKGQSLTVEALGSGDISYKWYNASNDSEVSGATEATFNPTESGKYYCKATSGTTTIQTSTAEVTVSGTVSNGGSGSESLLATLPSTETTTVTCNGTSGTISGSDYLMSGENCYTLNSGGTCVLTIHEGVTVSKIEIIGTSSDNSTQSTIGISDCSGGGNLNTSKSTEGKTTLTFTPTKQASSYTITSSGKGSYIHIKVYGTTTSSSSLSITDPKDATYDVGASNVTPLSVTVTGAEAISYQWCSNTTNSNTNGTPINGATSASYKPVVTTAGTTYYYCIASAGGQSVTSNAAAVAVLNASDLKTKYNAAWTPIANGTIEVGNLVTSSSKGAYSITTGNDDVAQISGTTITALKAGTFTLSQEADDKYKAGSIDITVRIGTNVTSDGTNEYSFTAQTTDVSDNMTITRDNITMTFGNDGFWSQPSANSYTNGQTNPKNSQGQNPSTGEIPSIGTFYKFTPTKPGSLAVKIKLGTTESEGSYSLRPLYVSENGTFISAKLTGDITVGTGQTPSYSQKSYEGDVTFDVKKGKDYYVYVTGSKLGFYGFRFTSATVYTVTYNMNGHGTQIDAVTDDNTLPETLPTPTADGYTFVAWYTDKALTQEAAPGAAISAPTTLYAKWIPITDLFSLTDVTSTNKTVASNTTYDVTSADATVTGGSVQLYNGNSKSSADMILSSQINLNGSGGSYMKITLDNTLKAGDEIIINPSLSVFNLKKTTDGTPVSFTGSYVIKAEDAVVGQKEIYLYNNKDGNSVIENISISHPESDSRATFTYNGTPIAFSEKTTGVYTTTLEIGARKKGETITITPSVKDGASIKQGETVVSGDITIAVPSEMGETTTYTYTVTSKDETSTTTYEINVKLVKDNVVLVFADSENKTGWTWDKTVNTTKPTFTQPTLTAYLANEDGTASSTEVTIKTNIKYLSDVKDVATVDEKNGTITIKDDANGGAKIYAILEGHPDYNDAQTFFNILVKQGYSYSVAGDATIEKGPSLNTSVYIKKGDKSLVKMTFGGWKWNTYKDDQDNNKVKSKYLVKDSEKTDQWNAAITSDEETIASIDGYKTSVSGATDAVDEAKAASDEKIYGSTRYGWFKPAKERTTDHYLETYPYTLPVRGAYMTFEPTQNGKLTVYILQNGAWNTFDEATTRDGVSYAKGDIIPGEFRPHSFYICNQRGLNVSQFSPKTFNVATKQKVQGKYYCDSKNPDKQSDPYNIATWTEFNKYMSEAEQADVEANWNSGINGAQEIVKLDNGSYLAIQKGIVKYTFFVTANETYYLFSNFSKLGFCGANFVPSATVVPEDDYAHKMTLDDKTAYPTIKKVSGDTDADKNKYAWKFGDDIKGYVPGFTIPLFKSITLNREFKKDQWTTLCLPFNLTQTEVEQIFGKGTQVLVFDDATITDVTKLHVKFFYHEIQNILPGYPYLIRPTLVDADGTAMTTNETSTDQAPTYTITGGVLQSFTVYDKAINPNIELHKIVSGNKLYVAQGTPDYCTKNTVTFDGKDYPYSTKYNTGDLFISDSDGKLYESAGDSYGKGYRSFIDYTGTSSASKSLTISFSGVEDSDDNGGTTEIKVAELDNGIRQALGFVGVYNLNGQKVAETTHNLPAGIYIVNGRKLVVK